MSDDGIQVWAPMEVVEGLLARAEKAEAAIQRVREVCDGVEPDHSVWCGDILDALEGDGTEDNQADFWDGDVPLGVRAKA